MKENPFTKNWSIQKIKNLEETRARFSLTEKLIFYMLGGILVISSMILFSKLNNYFLVEVPSHGGMLTEGIVGFPRFVNPLLAISDADRDVTALVYSGLLKATPEGGLAPDIAESYTISPDGLTYTFTLKKDAVFHDGSPVSADDIVWTIEKAQDPAIKSPKRANWEGVEVKKLNDRQVEFILKQSYASFLQNATVGILPKHLWQEITSEEFIFSPANVEAVGSGPYKIYKVKRGPSGAPTYYELQSFKKYTGGEPFISRLILKFYTNEEKLLGAFRAGEIESVNSITPTEATKFVQEGRRIERSTLPRIFGVFLNQNQARVLSESPVRAALEHALDKQIIIDSILLGFGTPIDDPIPPGILNQEKSNMAETASSTEKALPRIDEAKAMLEKAGWKMSTTTGIMSKTAKKVKTYLAFSLSTSNVPELKATAELLKATWEKIGVKVDVKIFEAGDLNQSVIRPRKYDTLLFGEIVGRDLDLFAFWHSSQRNDPGLNIALYTNIKADKLLEDGRREIDEMKRLEKYKMFEEEVRKDIPAIFVYSPDFLYALPKKVRGVDLESLAVPSERFLGIRDWYVNTEKVWNFFIK